MAEREKYPLHRHWIELFEKFSTMLQSLRNKETPLLINDSYCPPINYEKYDLPWTLGSKGFPWKNLFLSNKSASNLTPSRSEVIDVYTTLVNAVQTDTFEQYKEYVASTFSTKDEVKNITNCKEVDAIMDNWSYNEDPESLYYKKYILTLEASDQTANILFNNALKMSNVEIPNPDDPLNPFIEVVYEKVGVDCEFQPKYDGTTETIRIISYDAFNGKIVFLCNKDVEIEVKTGE